MDLRIFLLVAVSLAVVLGQRREQIRRQEIQRQEIRRRQYITQRHTSQRPTQIRQSQSRQGQGQTSRRRITTESQRKVVQQQQQSRGRVGSIYYKQICKVKLILRKCAKKIFKPIVYIFKRDVV